jgi:hypothetical protein
MDSGLAADSGVVDEAGPDAVNPQEGDRPDAVDREETDRPDAIGMRAGYSRCRELECDNRTQRCLLCPGFEAACVPLSGTIPCTGPGLVAYCDGNEDCEGTQQCEWRMGDIWASMICVSTRGSACNGFCGDGCGAICQRDEDCLRAACGSRCISPAGGNIPWPGFGRCR